MCSDGSVYPDPPSAIVNANVPPAPTVTDIFPPVPINLPAFIVIVSSVVAVIAVNIPARGSVDLGYPNLVIWLSEEHVNTKDSVPMPTSSEVDRPWFSIVNIVTPVSGSYVAKVGVK